MRIKFRKCGNVSSCTFHPSRPWALLGLREGRVEVWDYEANQLATQHPAHRGPIRAVCYHPVQRLYLTGSDDCKIKVWNYEKKKCVGVFLGHQDYVRKAVFHPQYPWIVSCSDDYSIRFWNWLSQEHLTTVTGHIHWVTAIDLHQSEDLLLSASVDNTVRLWDYSSLRNRVSNRGEHMSVSHLFGTMDVNINHIFEGFYKHPSWAIFHPDAPVICVGDSTAVRIFSLNSLDELKTLGVHRIEVTGGCFVTDRNFPGGRRLLLTVGKDKLVKTSDLRTGLCLERLGGEEGAIYSVEKHPTRNLFTSQVEKGMVVYKIARERPVYTVYKHHLYYIRDSCLYYLNMDRMSETLITKLAGIRNTGLSYNPSEHALIRNFMHKSLPHYQVYFLVDGVQNVSPKFKNCPGNFATWTAPGRFCHLEIRETVAQLVVKNMENQNVNFAGFKPGFLVAGGKTEKSGVDSSPRCERIFAGFLPHHVLLYDSTARYLLHYNTNRKRKVGSCHVGDSTGGGGDGATELKLVAWSVTGSHVALVSGGGTITVCDGQLLKTVCVHRVRSPARVKSCCWCPDTGALLYTTANQLRYLLVQGVEGGVCTLHSVLYLTMVTKGRVVGLNREQRWVDLRINSAEYELRTAVLAGDEDRILSLANSGRIVGQSQLKFLQECGRGDVALHFIQDPPTRFHLALSLNNTTAALESAKLMEKNSISCPATAWEQLGQLALLNGQLGLAETCYQRGRCYDRLRFLYLVSGQTEKLEKLSRILGVQQNYSGQYEIALILGNVLQQSAILSRAGEMTLFHLLEATHGLSDEAKTDGKGILLRGPVPLAPSHTDWPTVTQSDRACAEVKSWRTRKQGEEIVDKYRRELQHAVQ